MRELSALSRENKTLISRKIKTLWLPVVVEKRIISAYSEGVRGNLIKELSQKKEYSIKWDEMLQ